MMARQESTVQPSDVWSKLAAPLPQPAIAWRQDSRPPGHRRSAESAACAFKARLQILGVVREDVGTGTDYKQASTDAFKRAAVRFRVANELYAYETNWKLPSVVREAGPLVFLEALASGCFPLGTYFAGMAASIDAVAAEVGPEIADRMKVSPRAEETVADIARNVPAALDLVDTAKADLRRIAEDHYDWKSVSKKLQRELDGLAAAALASR